MKVKWSIAAVVVATAIGVAACSINSTPSSTQREQAASAATLNQLEQSQPTPQFKWSQYREILIDIETAQANSTQTTTFFFNMGVTAPISSCPSIGFPLASTTELTNPSQAVWNSGGTNGNAGVAIGQIDPNGVYSGDSTGSYILCVAPNGSTYVQYWEGFVQTISGPAVWNSQTNSVQLTGPSTVNVNTKH